jgi:RNA polymerase sigma factor (sigma-70 family)
VARAIEPRPYSFQPDGPAEHKEEKGGKQMRGQRIDSLLAPLPLKAGGKEADEFLARLIAAHAEPVINGVIRYKLRLDSSGGDAKAEAEDLRQEAIAQLLARLQKFRADAEAHSIKDLRRLAATIAYRLCARWMRRQFPERRALRNRIQYLLTRHAGFAIWREDPNGENESKGLIAGFAAWKGRRPSAGAASLGRLSQDEKLLDALGGGGRAARLNDALGAVLNHVGAPVEFDELVKMMADLLQIKDRMVESIDADPGDRGLDLADSEIDVAWRLEKRVFLQRLWDEVRQLPRQQRVALLLKLGDAEGRGCVALFPALGIATLSQLAEALEMSDERLAEMWNETPLEDAKIAELLRLTRQQVSNARKSARERLARRLKGFY